MVNGKNVLAVVPARGGSKSIPRKNVKPLGGAPLLAYAVAAGLDSKYTDRVIVSTDDPEIAETAKRYGAEAPFLRPSELAGDEATDLPVFRHAALWLAENEDYRPEIIVQLRPTSPFRPPGGVDEALDLLLGDPHADSVRAVTPSGQNPYKMWRIEGGRMMPLLSDGLPEPYNRPRQALPATYWQTGLLDAFRTRTLLEKGSLTGDRILPWICDPAYAVDLDTPAQWKFAEHWLRFSGTPIVRPRRSGDEARRIKLALFDFDGVFTDNRVWVSGEGGETVACSRADGLGLAALRASGVKAAVLSSETHPVVRARCEKLGLPCHQGVADKGREVEFVAARYGATLEETAFVGNDLNDLECLRRAGFAAAPADAHPDCLAEADLVLDRPGGFGAVREFCDWIIQNRRNGT